MSVIDDLKFDKDGLVPAIVQDSETGEVLMMAYMNREAFELTVRTGRTHFYSRSRKKLWSKGETSGNTQSVVEVCTDCDSDTILIKVLQKGAACHEGYKSCFFKRLEDGAKWKIVGERMFDPEKVYGKK
ncbi:MAG: phosphoribosyl-AMP cyclohydrolase [Candidatus Lindowbacteria bacterium]|nr:phosphoribosyl-AMP cyclohydrolase [Candidatus Lindowbacteria bacterium]